MVAAISRSLPPPPSVPHPARPAGAEGVPGQAPTTMRRPDIGTCMTPRPRLRAPLTPLPAIAALLVVALLGASACSDAHSQAQLDLANHGYDPDTVVILAPAGLRTTLLDLGTAFTLTHPGTSFVLVSDVVAGLLQARHRQYVPKPAANDKQALSADVAPSMWIDTTTAQQALRPPDLTVVGSPTVFGYDGVALVVKPGNPTGVRGLTSLARGSGVKVGLCMARTTCGGLAHRVLAAAKVTTSPVMVAPTAADLVEAIGTGRIQAALTLRSEAADAGPKVSVVALQPPPTTFLAYQTLRLDESPLADAFASWITTSPQAARVLAEHGYARTVGDRP